MVRILMSGLITFAIWKKRRPRKRGHIWFLQAIVLALLELSFMSLIPASAEQTPSTATQELVKNVDQLQAVLQSLQQRIDGIQSFLTQSADNLEKRAQDINTNLEKRSGDIKEEIVDLKAKNKQKKPDPFFAPSSLPSWVIITDIGIFLLAAAAVAITAVLWRGQSGARKKQHNESDAAFHNRKDLGQTGVIAQFNAGLTSATVLLAGAFALLGLARHADFPFPLSARTQVIVGVIWLIISVFTGVWNAGVISPKSALEDVSRVPSVNIMLALQLWSILLGGICLLLSLFLVV